MEYPFWHVPGLGSTMLIPVVALPHVLVSHFAVGGGILLWLGIRRAHRTDDGPFLGYLCRLTRFFVLVTAVFGAITGVGIWWTIALASPEATSTLIHAFVFGWATEWVAFVVELLAAFGLFYLWDRLGPPARERVALTYAVAAWISLVLITGILAFMVSAGRWVESRSFWDGFLNPTFLPGVVARTGGAVAITGLWVFLHVTLTGQAERVRVHVVTWAARWSFVGVALIAVGGAWWYAAAPAYVQAKLLAAPAVLIISSVCIGATMLLTAAIAFGPFWRSEWLVPPLAGLLFLMGATGMVSGEFLREAGRKPYTIERYLYSNGLRPSDVEAVRADGFLNRSRWARVHLGRDVPALFGADGRATPEAAAGLGGAERRQVGEVIYEHQCGTCHTRMGYNALLPRVRHASPETLELMILRMDELSSAMPPWAGRPWEAAAVVEYLTHAAHGGDR
jgi:mono/diheme cytochrome c family protein